MNAHGPNASQLDRQAIDDLGLAELDHPTHELQAFFGEKPMPS